MSPSSVPGRLPVPDRLALLWARAAAGEAYGAISIAEYRFFREHSRLLSHIAPSLSASTQSIDDGSGQRVRVEWSAYVDARSGRGDVDPGPAGHGRRSSDDAALRVSCVSKWATRLFVSEGDVRSLRAGSPT
jgi:hypothetical protein